MDANTEVDLDQLQQAIIDRIAAQFPDLVTVDDYRDDRKKLPVPACLIELTDLEPDPELNPGTEQLGAMARFEAHVVIGFKTPAAKRAIRKLAAAIGAYIHQQRWGQPVGGAEVTAITPDDFSPELDHLEAWRVEWQQSVHLGKSVWNNTEFPARMVVQLGNSVLDPLQPVEEQATATRSVVLATPADPEQPSGDWVEVSAPDQAGALYSHAPDVGPGHEPDYQPLVPGVDP